METPINTITSIFDQLWAEKKELQDEVARLKVFSNYLLHWAYINARFDSPFNTTAELRAYIDSEVDIIHEANRKYRND